MSHDLKWHGAAMNCIWFDGDGNGPDDARVRVASFAYTDPGMQNVVGLEFQTGFIVPGPGDSVEMDAIGGPNMTPTAARELAARLIEAADRCEGKAEFAKPEAKS